MKRKLPNLVFLMLMAGTSLLLLDSALAQTLESVRGFKIAEPYGPPFENQVKSLLIGAHARPLEGGAYLLTEVTLQTFRETGERELVVKTPQCVYDPARRMANSPGSLLAQTADGKFSIEGDGFLWQQTNSCLFISNHVHTVVQRDLLDPATAKPSPPTPKTQAAGIDIYSDSFDYAGGSSNATYSGHVRVAGTNLNLTAGLLLLQLPLNEPQKPAGLQRLTAEQDAVIDYGVGRDKIHVTGERVDYSVQTGLVRASGHPTWRSDQREGEGDELLLDRSNRIFQAIGRARLKMPGQSLGSSGLLSLPDSSGTTQIAPAPVTTNRFVEVLSQNYEFRMNPELNTNWGIFRENVRVNELLEGQPRGKLTSGLLVVAFTGSNELQRLEASKQVVIEQEDKLLKGELAVYSVSDRTNGVLELTGQPAPTWQAGLRQGRGDRLRLETQNQEMQAFGNAWMRLPARELDATAGLNPGSTNPPPARTATNDFADIFSQDYLIRTNVAFFRGGVRVVHSNLNWVCGSLSVQAGSGDERLVIGEGAVAFDLRDEKDRKIHGKGDKAVYTFGTMTNGVWLWGRPAVLETHQAQSLTNSSGLIILDRLHNTLVNGNPGDYLITGLAKAVDTNMFVAPKLKRPKK